MMQQPVRPTTRTRGCDLVRTILSVAAVVIVLASRSDCVWADTNNWIGTSGSWFTSANWSLGALPSSSDEAFVANTNIANAIIEGTTTATAGDLFINSGSVTVGNISAGALTVNGEISVGTLGTSGTLALNIGTISANTISIAANGTYSDTSSGAIILTGADPTINVANGVDAVVNSQITGTSGLIKGSLGTLTLAGNNTYSGGTTISLGTLQVGNGGTSGSLGSGDVVNNAALRFDRSDSVVVDNSISGVGSLTQAGSGTLTLTGNNTYSGGTTISSGTLQVGNGGTSGSLGSGTISDNAALVLDRSDSIVLSNTISGTGSLTQAGAGTLTLVGTNTYSGRTLISSGTLQVGDGGTLGTLGTGDISNNSALVFNRSDSVVVSNTISGGGSLNQAGAGTLTLVADNSYTGLTIISSGTLQVGNGGTLGTLGSGAISNNSVLIFSHSDDILVTNQISGSGSLTQAGTGTLTVTNVNTYSGGTWVENGGTLAVQDSHALGNGGVNLIDGTLKLNETTVYVGGSYTQGADGTLEITIAGTNTTSGSTNSYGQLNIGGTASLAGTVSVVQANGYVPEHNDQFVLVTASNGVTGTFSTFTNDFTYSSLLKPTLIYDTDDVTLKWEQLSFVPYALTRNQRAVAQDLNAVSSSTISSAVALVNYLDNLSDPSNSLPVAFNEISPEQLTAMFTMAFANMNSQGSRFLQRANELRADYRDLYIDAANRAVADGSVTVPSSTDASPGQSSTDILSRALDNPWSVYVEGGGDFAVVPGNTNAAGYNLSSGDFTIGADRQISRQLVVGGAVAYDSGQVSLTDKGHIDLDSYLAQLYAAWFREGLHVEGMLGGGINTYGTRREGLGGVATGSTDGLEYTALVGGGYDWQHAEWSFGPQLVVQYMSASIDAFDETGSMAPLHIESQSADSLHTQLGADLHCRHYIEPTLTFVTPEVYLAWQHEYLDTSLPLKSRLASGAGDVFTVYGPDLGSDSIIMSLGFTIQWKPTVSTYFHYTMQTVMQSRGYEANAVDAGMRINF
jgi:autotransporter-associated beta strand protein